MAGVLQTVDVGRRAIADYRGIVPDDILDQLHDVAADLQGARILHLNATPYGGGVAELLRSEVPLLNSLGLTAEWKVICGDQAFFQATKALHNALQGADRTLTEEERAHYVQVAHENAAALEEVYDFVVVHDPQPAPIPAIRGKNASRWVWRCHIDTSQPNPEAWAFLRTWLGAYDAAVFTLASFVPPDFPVERVEVIAPAIDPLSPKNLPLPEPLARQVLNWIGLELDRPLITQVARFDPWKDPLGVIQAYRLAREQVPGIELALVGSMALDDPEGWEVYRLIRRESERDPLIHVFSNLTGVGNIEVNAFQRLSRVVVQKSLREGFGLVVSEALWKGTPVVAGEAGGIPLQMADGVGGYLVGSVEACAGAVVRLLEDTEAAAELGRAGRERVRRQFLLPRLLLDELALLRRLAARPFLRERAEGPRDPVCGMAVSHPGITAEHGGRTHTFCSEACHNRFLADPARYGDGGGLRP